MNALRQTLPCLCLAAGCLLALGHPGQALADPIDFSFRQGPSAMVIPVNDYRQFHSHLTNTGDEADSYTLRATAQDPENWTFNVCYDGTCYPPDQTVFTVPASGTLAPGATIDFDFDVTSLFDEGPAHYIIEIVSNTDDSVARTLEFDVMTPVDGLAMLWAAGEGVEHVAVNGFVQFHPVLYNAGTTADSYTLTAIRNQPANWSSTFCFDGICYPPDATEQQIPDGGGTIASGAAVPMDIDFTTLFDEGMGSMTVIISSNTDPSLRSTATFTVTTGSVVSAEDLPGSLLSGLHAAPNPFNPRTEIRFTVGGATAQDAVIDIFDAAGRRVRTLFAGALQPGLRGVAWDGCADSGEAAAAGTYLARVHVGPVQQTVKMSLVK